MRTKEWLIKKRKELKLTQKELSKKCGINHFTIENIEQGKRLGSVQTWEKIENFFNDMGTPSLKVSYDSEELIKELKNDIKEFGKNCPCILVYKIINDRIIFTNYDFITYENSFNPEEELEEDETYIESTLKYALEVFERQNKIL